MVATNRSGKTRAPQTGRKTARPRRGGKSLRRRWLLRGIAACALAVLALVGWAAVERALAPRSNTALDHFDAIIVLGYPADADGNPQPTQLARVTEAVHEYERGVAPRIIVTGGAAANRFIEAQVMARTAEAQGVPADAVFIEPAAMDTIQNACYSLHILRNHGWRSAEVVSSSSHLPRAAMILSRLPLEWRVHEAPPLEPQSAAKTTALTIMETLKTARYLVWARQTEPCQL